MSRSIADLIYRSVSFVRTSRNHNTGENENFNWKEAVLDALIISGLNFFSTLSALSVLQILKNPAESLLAASISAGFGFFSTLAIKRGIKRE